MRYRSQSGSSVKPGDRPSIADGFSGIILSSAGMVAFLVVILAVRYYTKDTSLETGSIVLVLGLIAIILAVAAFQYFRLKRGGHNPAGVDN